MLNTPSQLYLINTALLATHEIDSAFWHEWQLFHLPGGIQLFLLANFLIFLVVLFGFTRVILWSKGARLFSYALACLGIFAFVIHIVFIALGHAEFRTPVSIAILAAIFGVSITQVLVLRSSDVQADRPAPDSTRTTGSAG